MNADQTTKPLSILARRKAARANTATTAVLLRHTTNLKDGDKGDPRHNLYQDVDDSISAAMATLVNAIITQQRASFAMTRDSFMAMMKADKNHATQQGLDNNRWREFLKECYDNKLIELVQSPAKKKPGVYQVIDQEILDLLNVDIDQQRTVALSFVDRADEQTDEGADAVLSNKNEVLSNEKEERRNENSEQSGSENSVPTRRDISEEKTGDNLGAPPRTPPGNSVPRTLDRNLDGIRNRMGVKASLISENSGTTHSLNSERLESPCPRPERAKADWDSIDLSIGLEEYFRSKGIQPIIKGENYLLSCFKCGNKSLFMDRQSTKFICSACKKKGVITKGNRRSWQREAFDEKYDPVKHGTDLLSKVPDASPPPRPRTTRATPREGATQMQSAGPRTKSILVNWDGLYRDIEFPDSAHHDRLFSDDGVEVMKYLTDERHLPISLIKKYYLGRCKRSDENIGVAIPHYDSDSLVSFMYRSLPRCENRYFTVSSFPKPLFNGNILHTKPTEIILTKGQFDAMVMDCCYSHANVVCPFDSRNLFSDEDLRSLAGVEKITIVCADDEASLQWARQVAGQLGEHRCFLARLPRTAQDVNDAWIKGLAKDEIDKCLQNAICATMSNETIDVMDDI